MSRKAGRFEDDNSVNRQCDLACHAMNSFLCGKRGRHAGTWVCLFFGGGEPLFGGCLNESPGNHHFGAFPQKKAHPHWSVSARGGAGGFNG